MKKIGQIIILMGVFFFLVACGQSNSTKQATSENKEQATIILKEDGKEIKQKKVSFKQTDSLLTIMETNFSVEVEKNFVSGIDGHQQNASQNKYWLYDVNGKQPDVGAGEYFLKNGDTVTWSLDKL